MRANLAVQRTACPGWITLRDDEQRDIRNQVEQNDANLVYPHGRVMDGIELFNRQSKPSTVESMHPVMSKHEDKKPQQQNAIVDNSAPTEDITHYLDAHDDSPWQLTTWASGARCWHVQANNECELDLFVGSGI